MTDSTTRHPVSGLTDAQIWASHSTAALRIAAAEYEAADPELDLADIARRLRDEIARREDHGPGCDGPLNCTCTPDVEVDYWRCGQGHNHLTEADRDTCDYDAASTPDPERAPAPDRNEAIAIIRAELKRRSGKSWSVTGGRGTVWGWITVTAPPARRDRFGAMSDEDRAELAKLLGVDVHHQGVSIPAGSDYRREYVDRARGLAPSTVGTPYWD